jgi:hypothetical protein
MPGGPRRRAGKTTVDKFTHTGELKALPADPAVTGTTTQSIYPCAGGRLGVLTNTSEPIPPWPSVPVREFPGHGQAGSKHRDRA